MIDKYKAARYRGFGNPEVIEIGEKAIRDPKKDEVLIEVEASSVSAADVMVRKGVIPLNLGNYVPGYDLVGAVVGIGRGVDRSWLGRRVIALVVRGGNAEFAYARPSQLIPIPVGLDPVQAAASGLNYATALGLFSLAPSGKLFFPGLTGGVGTALLDLSRNLPDLALFGSVHPGTEAIAEGYGARAWSYRDPDYRRKAAAMVPEGFDAVFDPFGGKRREENASLLGPSSRLIGYGYGGRSLLGYQANVFAYALGGPGRIFFSIRALAAESPRKFSELLKRLEILLAEGRVEARIAGVYALPELRQAHERFENGGLNGKLVIRMKG